jgi:hypothetical protein
MARQARGTKHDPAHPPPHTPRPRISLRARARQAVPLLSQPRACIQGLPAINKLDFLENRREVLVQDTSGNVSSLDVTTGRQTQRFPALVAPALPAPWQGVLAAMQTGVLDDGLGMMPVHGACAKSRGCAARLPGPCSESMGVGSFGQVKFDDQRKALAQPLAVTPWCSADCKLGCVAVNLDFAQVFGCEVYASDAGFAAYGPDYDEQKLNVGLRVCRSLFRCSCVLVLIVPP